jgi:hypothetical protein
MMEAMHASEKLVLKKATWSHILEEDILHGQRLENLRSYIALTSWAP